MTRTKRVKRVQDRWETAIMPDRCDDGRFHSLIINRVDAKKFRIGDKVRVTVTLLARGHDTD
jgi:hypothetical protein